MFKSYSFMEHEEKCFELVNTVTFDFYVIKDCLDEGLLPENFFNLPVKQLISKVKLASKIQVTLHSNEFCDSLQPDKNYLNDDSYGKYSPDEVLEVSVEEISSLNFLLTRDEIHVCSCALRDKEVDFIDLVEEVAFFLESYKKFLKPIEILSFSEHHWIFEERSSQTFRSELEATLQSCDDFLVKFQNFRILEVEVLKTKVNEILHGFNEQEKEFKNNVLSTLLKNACEEFLQYENIKFSENDVIIEISKINNKVSKLRLKRSFEDTSKNLMLESITFHRFINVCELVYPFERANKLTGQFAHFSDKYLIIIPDYVFQILLVLTNNEFLPDEKKCSFESNLSESNIETLFTLWTDNIKNETFPTVSSLVEASFHLSN